jgi:TonB family protein
MKIVLRKSDRLFLALIAVALGYLVIFMMLQMSALEEQENIIPFNDATAEVQIKDELELTKDNIEIIDNSSNQNLTNSARDLNDTRKKSMDDWSENKPSSYQNSDPVQAAKDFEKQLFAEAGGAKERERIVQDMNERKDKKTKTNPTNPKTTSNANGSNNQFAGNVMVDFKLDNRTAFENNNWYIRNPGYKCGVGSSGTVMIRVKVNPSGQVIDAYLDEASSNGLNSCMIDEALTYARKSKFNFSQKAPASQSGYIRYRFVSQ